jgi:hypothetical protein
MTRLKTWGTWRGGAMALTAVLGLSLAGCGGGSSGPPKSLSMSGVKLPVTQITNGLASLCTVTTQATKTPTTTASAYFGGPYTQVHQLAAILKGARRTALLVEMEEFERAALLRPPGSTLGTEAATLLKTVKSDLESLKVKPPACM